MNLEENTIVIDSLYEWDEVVGVQVTVLNEPIELHNRPIVYKEIRLSTGTLIKKDYLILKPYLGVYKEVEWYPVINAIDDAREDTYVEVDTSILLGYIMSKSTFSIKESEVTIFNVTEYGKDIYPYNKEVNFSLLFMCGTELPVDSADVYEYDDTTLLGIYQHILGCDMCLKNLRSVDS